MLSDDSKNVSNAADNPDRPVVGRLLHQRAHRTAPSTTHPRAIGRVEHGRAARLGPVTNRRLLLSPLWFIVALVTLVGPGTSSAAASSAAETRVRAIDTPTEISVGQQSSERPASVGCLRPDQPESVVGACVATEAASDATSSLSGTNLGRRLASEQQLGEAGTSLAGAGSKPYTPLRASEGLAENYGGNAADWSKMGSSSYRGADGRVFETHWYENAVTGVKTEFKTKFPESSWFGFK